MFGAHPSENIGIMELIMHLNSQGVLPLKECYDSSAKFLQSRTFTSHYNIARASPI